MTKKEVEIMLEMCIQKHKGFRVSVSMAVDILTQLLELMEEKEDYERSKYL